MIARLPAREGDSLALGARLFYFNGQQLEERDVNPSDGRYCHRFIATIVPPLASHL